MIRAYEKIINRMRLAGLGLKKHTLYNKAWRPSKNAYKYNRCNTNCPPLVITDATRQCQKPPSYVPYKCTYVPYDGTFGTSDQGQTLDL